MLTIISFVISTIVVSATTWFLGKRRYYDQEDLVDLAVGSWSSGYLVYLAWGLIPIVRNFRGVWEFAGMIVGGLVFTLWYVRRLRWPIWPSFGFLICGWGLGTLVLGGLLRVLSGWSAGLWLSIIGLLTFIVALYIVEFNGEARIRGWLNRGKQQES